MVYHVCPLNLRPSDYFFFEGVVKELSLCVKKVSRNAAAYFVGKARTKEL